MKIAEILALLVRHIPASMKMKTYKQKINFQVMIQGESIVTSRATLKAQILPEPRKNIIITIGAYFLKINIANIPHGSFILNSQNHSTVYSRYLKVERVPKKFFEIIGVQ